MGSTEGTTVGCDVGCANGCGVTPTVGEPVGEPVNVAAGTAHPSGGLGRSQTHAFENWSPYAPAQHASCDKYVVTLPGAGRGAALVHTPEENSLDLSGYHTSRGGRGPVSFAGVGELVGGSGSVPRHLPDC